VSFSFQADPVGVFVIQPTGFFYVLAESRQHLYFLIEWHIGKS